MTYVTIRRDVLRQMCLDAAAMAVVTERKGEYPGAAQVADEVMNDDALAQPEAQPIATVRVQSGRLAGAQREAGMAALPDGDHALFASPPVQAEQPEGWELQVRRSWEHCFPTAPKRDWELFATDLGCRIAAAAEQAAQQGEPHVAAIDTSAERVEKSAGIEHVRGEPSDEAMPPLPEAANDNRTNGRAGFHAPYGPMYTAEQMRDYARAVLALKETRNG